MSSAKDKPTINPLKERIHEIIFEADTPVGRVFDVSLIIAILASILIVMLESVDELNQRYGQLFFILEWLFTIFFTIEYLLRIYCVYKPWKYITSFFGIVDLLATAPSYLSLFLPGSQYFLTIRILRLLRIFRIFKMGHFMDQGAIIVKALRSSRTKIAVFLYFILLLVVIIGSIMYLIEGGVNSGFSSIPRSIYWAIVTLTTVGFGDITPQTELGQFFSAIVMILGYAVIAVPTGIVSSEFISKYNEIRNINTQACRYCGEEGHDDDAVYCKYCGEILNEKEDG
ncbi:MAG: ion transporter [Bacteroidota bacterium]